VRINNSFLLVTDNEGILLYTGQHMWGT